MNVAGDREAALGFYQFPLACSHKLTCLKYKNVFKFTVLEARRPKWDLQS